MILGRPILSGHQQWAWVGGSTSRHHLCKQGNMPQECRTMSILHHLMMWLICFFPKMGRFGASLLNTCPSLSSTECWQKSMSYLCEVLSGPSEELMWKGCTKSCPHSGTPMACQKHPRDMPCAPYLLNIHQIASGWSIPKSAQHPHLASGWNNSLPLHQSRCARLWG